MGVCGYTYDEVQKMPMAAIARAINARKKWDVESNQILVKMVFGDPDQPDTAAPPANVAARKMSPELFDALFQ